MDTRLTRRRLTLLLLGISLSFAALTYAQPATPQGTTPIYLPLVRGVSPTSTTPPPPSGGTLPTALARQWFTGSMTTISFYDPVSGAWSQPSGLGELYRFAADGSYTYAGALKIQNGACVSEVSVYQTGAARAMDSELELRATFSRTRTRIICGGTSESVSKDLPAVKRIAYRVALGKEGRTELTLGAGDAAKTYGLLGIDEQLIGAWQLGGVSVRGFYDPGTGQWARPSAAGEWYQFRPDGRLTYGRYVQQQDEDGCTVSAWVYQTGEFSMSGSRLTTRFTAGRGRLVNSCAPGEVQDEPFVIAKPGEYTWQRQSGGQDEQLRLIQLMPFGSWTYTRTNPDGG